MVCGGAGGIRIKIGIEIKRCWMLDTGCRRGCGRDACATIIATISVGLGLGQEFGEGRADGFAGFEAEEAFELLEHEVAFFFVEVAIQIEAFEFESCGLGAAVAVFSENQGLAAEAGESVEHAVVIGRVVGELAFSEGLEDLSEGDVDHGFLEGGVVVFAEKVQGRLTLGAEVIEPDLLFEPSLVTVIFPFREVLGFEMLAGVAQAFDDVRVGYAVADGEVDLIAEGFGQAGDVAVAAMGGGIWGWIGGLMDWWIGALRSEGFGVCDLRFGVHGRIGVMGYWNDGETG